MAKFRACYAQLYIERRLAVAFEEHRHTRDVLRAPIVHIDPQLGRLLSVCSPK